MDRRNKVWTRHPRGRKVTVSFRLPEDEADELDAYMIKVAATKSAVVRGALKSAGVIGRAAG